MLPSRLVIFLHLQPHLFSSVNNHRLHRYHISKEEYSGKERWKGNQQEEELNPHHPNKPSSPASPSSTKPPPSSHRPQSASPATTPPTSSPSPKSPSNDSPLPSNTQFVNDVHPSFYRESPRLLGLRINQEVGGNGGRMLLLLRVGFAEGLSGFLLLIRRRWRRRRRRRRILRVPKFWRMKKRGIRMLIWLVLELIFIIPMVDAYEKTPALQHAYLPCHVMPCHVMSCAYPRLISDKQPTYSLGYRLATSTGRLQATPALGMTSVLTQHKIPTILNSLLSGTL